MEDKIQQLLAKVERNDSNLSEEEFNKIVKGFDFKFPQSYIKLMRDFNGGEGEIWQDSWLCLFPLSELKQINVNYGLLMSDIPDYFLFGMDAADTGYAFNKIKGTFHSFGLMSNFETDSIDFLGNNFLEFLEHLENYRYEE